MICLSIYMKESIDCFDEKSPKSLNWDKVWSELTITEINIIQKNRIYSNSMSFIYFNKKSNIWDEMVRHITALAMVCISFWKHMQYHMQCSPQQFCLLYTFPLHFIYGLKFATDFCILLRSQTLYWDLPHLCLPSRWLHW